MARATDLADVLRRRIAREGPIPVADFMGEALGHPQHGYYTTRDPLGARGDFTTAPEISQMFGELIGLWCVQMWLDLGRPAPFAFIELGPGRGTLAADALRAARVVPEFGAAARVHLVETSPVLRQRQAEALRDLGPTWHDGIATLPEIPGFTIANEFFDALPIRQFERSPLGWRERVVTLRDGELAFALAAQPTPSLALVPPELGHSPVGSVVEVGPAGLSVARALGERVERLGGAALIVDYGYVGPAAGDTLQALKAHRFVPPLESPGEADLTAHVDFGALAREAASAGAQPWGPVGQGAFLRALGIEARAARLKERASPEQAADIDAALARLTADDRMGELFKVLALTPTERPPPGFDIGSAWKTGRDRRGSTTGRPV